MKSALALEKLLRGNDLALSRTARTGTVDNKVSPRKKASLITGSDLFDALDRNRAAVARFIVAQSPLQPKSPLELIGVLLVIAFLTNDGISPNGLFRIWDYEPQVSSLQGARVKPEDIPRDIESKANSLLEAFQTDSKREKLAAIAGIEWDLGIGPLHPFYDGCGRISRYFSALNCLWLNLPIVQHTSREEYMGHASEGRCAFTTYYLAQVDRSTDIPSDWPIDLEK
jgi:hypothetical protein